jgi:U3 small nucleolar RNA-associated protein 4
VQFWDGVTCTHTSRIESHTADILCLAVSDDERCVFASGMDHKVVCLKRLSSTNVEDAADTSVWSLAHAYRAHQLDVRALAVVHLSKSTAPEHNAVGPWNPSKPNRDGSVNLAHREILVSGGLDTKLCTYHVRHFAEHRPKRIWPFPYHNVVSISPVRRLLLAQHRDKLELWQLSSRDEANRDKEVNHRLLCELRLNREGGSGLVCSAVSANGCFLAASDTQELRVFRLISKSAGDGGMVGVTVKKLILTEEAMDAAQLVSFANNRLITACKDGSIRILTLPSEDEVDKKIVVEHSFSYCDEINKVDEKGNDEFVGLPFTSMAVSSDGAWLAVAGTGNHVLVFSLDSMSIHWKLPTCSSRITSLAFPPAFSQHNEDTSLILASVDNRIHVYSVEARKLADW